MQEASISKTDIRGSDLKDEFDESKQFEDALDSVINSRKVHRDSHVATMLNIDGAFEPLSPKQESNTIDEALGNEKKL